MKQELKTLADRPDWSSLNHAYGKADDIPQLLQQLSPDKTAEAWDELWSRICHQDTVYSASFPCLPFLLEAALRWSPTNRVMPLFLAAAIVISDGVKGSREAFMEGLSQTVDQCHKLAVETLKTGELSRQDRIYLMESALAFDGDAVWGRRLDGLVNGELQVACSNCQTFLYVVIGESGFFVTAEE
ncbi:MAG: hypothetical protein IMF08_15340 [Proteobacteria bacterium]|nr:hypothetical protein [Pseudomonadota bacterium]